MQTNSSVFNFKTIEKRFSKLKQYQLGFKQTQAAGGLDSICFGIGWNKPNLYMINITGKGIVYAYSNSNEATTDIAITLPYKEDFEIPQNVNEFQTLLNKHAL